jgi:hypothetical protein
LGYEQAKNDLQSHPYSYQSPINGFAIVGKYPSNPNQKDDTKNSSDNFHIE